MVATGRKSAVPGWAKPSPDPGETMLRSTVTKLLMMGSLMGCVLSQTAYASEPENREPSLVFYFDVGGKRVPLELDTPFSTQILGGAKAATLRLEPHREFAYAGLRFQYPREYTFEAKVDSPKVATWTLSGNACTLMVHRYRAESNAEALQRSVVDEILKAFGPSKKKESPVQLALRDTTLRGIRIDVELATAQIQQDVYAFRSGSNVTVLIVQDALGEDGKSTVDRVRTEKLLRESLRLPK